MPRPESGPVHPEHPHPQPGEPGDEGGEDGEDGERRAMTKMIQSLGLLDLFVIYIAAIGHDVAHPGFSNAFMVRVMSLLVLLSFLSHPFRPVYGLPVACADRPP
jgi:hypothetical protein